MNSIKWRTSQLWSSFGYTFGCIDSWKVWDVWAIIWICEYFRRFDISPTFVSYQRSGGVSVFTFGCTCQLIQWFSASKYGFQLPAWLLFFAHLPKWPKTTFKIQKQRSETTFWNNGQNNVRAFALSVKHSIYIYIHINNIFIERYQHVLQRI